MEEIVDEVQEDKQALIVLTGNIGCGKTIITEYLLQEYEGRKIVAVSNDSITMMTGNGDYTRYQPVLCDMYKEMYLKCVCAAIDAGATVVCDNAHMSKQHRARLIKIAKGAGIAVTSIDLGPGSPESLKRRQDAEDDRETSNSVWCLVHQRFAKQYEPCTTDEGFDLVTTSDQIWGIINAEGM